MEDRATAASSEAVSYYLASGPQLRPPANVTSAASPHYDITTRLNATNDGDDTDSLPPPPPSPPPSPPPPPPPPSFPQHQTYSVEPGPFHHTRLTAEEPLPQPPGLDESGVNLTLDDDSYSNLNVSRASYNRPLDASRDVIRTAAENPAYFYDPTEHDSNNDGPLHDVSYSRNLPSGRTAAPAAEPKPDDSLDSVSLGPDGDDGDDDDERAGRVDDSIVSPVGVGRGGLENEAYAYDGDYETDFSFQGGPPFEEVPTMRNKDPLPILERPMSGRYLKNPVLERGKPVVAKGPYIPQAGVYLNPPLAIKKDSPPENTQVRRRIPRPPKKWWIKCAYFWSCCACLLGSFFCAIPALRYTVSASESRKIGDYNSANSNLRKTAALATVAMAIAVGGWTVVIMYLSGSLS